jgi:hypothetical protein
MNRLHSMVVVCGLLAGCGEKAKAVEQKLAAEAEMAMGVPAGTGPYAQPSSPCDVVDLAPLGSRVGRATQSATETEGDSRPITGCVVDLEASDGDNRFRLFVSVDSDPDTRFSLFEDAWNNSPTSGFVTEPVDGLGNRAIYAARLTNDGLHIDTVLGVLDQNLYLEARFVGDGRTTWDSADMRERLAGVAGAAMRTLAR